MAGFVGADVKFDTTKNVILLTRDGSISIGGDVEELELSDWGVMVQWLNTGTRYIAAIPWDNVASIKQSWTV